MLAKVAMGTFGHIVMMVLVFRLGYNVALDIHLVCDLWSHHFSSIICTKDPSESCLSLP